MPRTQVALRELTAEERQALEQLAASRTAQARFVERARILLALDEGRPPSQVAQELGVSRPTVYTWLHRFNDQGLAGLEDQPRAGRPPTYTAEQRAEVIATALTDPKSLGLPFGCWTLDRLQAYLNEQKGLPIKRSRIDELLLDEGLKWRHQETWFGERVDPAFAEKRGSSRRSTRLRRKGPSSSASTRWGRRAPRASRDSSPSTPNPGRGPKVGPRSPSEPSRRSTTGGAARDTSSGPSARRPARR
jgi:transposase